NDRTDLFVRDLRRGRLQRVVDPLGELSSPALSANGRYLAYTAQDGATSAVVVRDLRTGRTERADVDLPMPFENGATPALSADGRTVAFTVDDSDSTTTGAQAVYVRDLRARRTEQVSFPADGDAGFRGFRAPTISADGRTVAYQYVHGTPPRGDWSDLYVHDRDTGGETQADTTHDGSPADGAATNPQLSADGATLAFDSGASNLVPGRDPNDSVNPFVRDLRTGNVTRIDAVLPGPDGVLSVDGVSADGSKLLLDTWPVLTVDDAEFVRDLRTGANALVSPDKDGRPANAVGARMDARARTVVFGGFDDEHFVAGDTNGVQDVFVRTAR
ncbi:TolB family protein, partial [Streptomyces sp. NPDC059063]